MHGATDLQLSRHAPQRCCQSARLALICYLKYSRYSLFIVSLIIVNIQVYYLFILVLKVNDGSMAVSQSASMAGTATA